MKGQGAGSGIIKNFKSIKAGGVPSECVGPVGHTGYVPPAFLMNVSLDKHNLGAWEALFDLEEILSLFVIYFISGPRLLRGRLSKSAPLNQQALTASQLPVQLQGAAFPHLWGGTLVCALCSGPDRKESPPSHESPAELRVWKLPVGERA